MQEQIQAIAASNGIDAETAQKAIGMILGFLQKEGDTNAVTEMLNSIPGAEALVAQAGESAAGGGGGLMGGLMGMVGNVMGSAGGGVMALGSQLMGEGLSMDQITGVSKQLFEVAREKAGEEVVGKLVASIPGLSKFV